MNINMNEIVALNELEKQKIKKYVRDFYGVFTQINFLSITTSKEDLNYTTLVKYSMANRYATIEFKHNEPEKVEADKNKYISSQKVYFKIEGDKELGLKFFEEDLEIINFEGEKYYKILEIDKNYNKVDSKLKPLIEKYYTLKPFNDSNSLTTGYTLEIENNEVALTKHLNNKVHLNRKISKDMNGNVLNDILQISESNFENLIFSYSKNNTLSKQKIDFNCKEMYNFSISKENNIMKNFSTSLSFDYNHQNVIFSYNSKKEEYSAYFKYEKENLLNQGTDDFCYNISFDEKNDKMKSQVNYFYEANGSKYTSSELDIDSALFFTSEGHDLLSITDDLNPLVLQKNSSYINYCLKEINFKDFLKCVEIPDINNISDFISFKNIQLKHLENSEKTYRNMHKSYLNTQQLNSLSKKI